MALRVTISPGVMLHANAACAQTHWQPVNRDRWDEVSDACARCWDMAGAGRWALGTTDLIGATTERGRERPPWRTERARFGLAAEIARPHGGRHSHRSSGPSWSGRHGWAIPAIGAMGEPAYLPCECDMGANLGFVPLAHCVSSTSTSVETHCDHRH
ncbi:hypothetical protein BN1723_009142 [Verticillium longisporum]|uniref:Uncharacterized protein n=1 Tax=Verticillium longisporum TaxID=100787 RepID=A0A0G4KYU2_VERLO|nr:hypothetical protein BN1723_009142 [Verticillium longisporum]CRK14600.1 hypothetical protein BN1708_011186 [Verticillium longisporum]